MAVYTPVSQETLRTYLAAYDLGELVSFCGIAEGVENSNFDVLTTGGRFILTIFERRVAPSDLPYFLALLEHLSTREIPCPMPIRDRRGSALQELAGKPAALVNFLPGAWPRVIDVAHCAALGHSLAEIHIAGQTFPLSRPNTLGPGGWRGLLNACRDRADELDAALANEIAEEIGLLEEAWPADLPSGVIHGDLFPDNLFFTGHRVTGVIDFYFACNDLLAYDVAVCLNAWCFTGGIAFEPDKAEAMLTAYRAVRPISVAEARAMPLLARGAALRFLLTRLYDWLHRVEGASVELKDPREYLLRLRAHREFGSAGIHGFG